MKSYRTFVTVAVGILAVLLTACGGGNSATSGTKGTTVAITLQEWGITASPASAPAGKVTFDVTNKGPAHEHEFVVVKTDIALSALRVNANGSLIEDSPGIHAEGEIEDIAVGATPSKSFTLTAGRYVLFCNVVETKAFADMPGTMAHYKLGMRTEFTVT
jgi:uncharacterized cupredoxin-like copper-binding protein